jgi:hypothetical protein
MNAEIFFHPEQDAKVQSISTLLSKRIHPGMSIVRAQAVSRPGLWDPDYAYPKATRYVQLMLAAIPPDRGLGLGVEWIYYGFYMYSHYFGQYRTFQYEGTRDLLPAVAVNDRMVLIPERAGERLTGSEGLAIFRPLEMGGLMEVDFDQPELVDKALTKVGDMLRAEAVQAVRRYASYRPHADLHLEEAARDLGLETSFLADALKQHAGKSAFYEKLTCVFRRTTFPMNRWTRVTVDIANGSDVGLHGLTVTITGPVRIRPEHIEVDVPAESSTPFDIALRPEEAGEFPIELSFSLAGDRALREWLPLVHVWLKTGDDA